MIWLWRIVIIAFAGWLIASAYFGSFLMLSIVIIALIAIEYILDLNDERMEREKLILSQKNDQQNIKSIVTDKKISKVD
ncbi:MAG: hypothetical protein PHI97_00370 [Desulfobulbus sp.]|nr:hypothetical protein [Desulfobulbus sp.]